MSGFWTRIGELVGLRRSEWHGHHTFGSPLERQDAEAERRELMRLMEGKSKPRNLVQQLAAYVCRSLDWSILPDAAKLRLQLTLAALGEIRKSGLSEPPAIRDAIAEVEQQARQVAQERMAHQAEKLRQKVAQLSPQEASQVLLEVGQSKDGRKLLALLQGTSNLPVPAPVAVPVDKTATAAALEWQAARAARAEAERQAEARRHQASEALLAATGMADYAAFFPEARALRRRLVFHVGPTNSGKTHDAMKQLATAETGVYLAPLRLLALEGFDRLVEAGTAVSLRTGDDRQSTDADPSHVASTIEMLDIHTHVEVAVIDEVQMLKDQARGWAWTRAVVGAPADTVILLGSRDALPLVEQLCRITGDTLEVMEHERRSRLRATGPVGLDELRPGDAVVAFSRAELHRLREQLAGIHAVSMLYGALSPPVRRAEAARFRNGDTGILLATDAIGMGLNLPVRRVVLASGRKFDGEQRRPLNPSELRQICGRAGRGSEDGEAAFLVGAEVPLDPAALQSVLDAAPDAHPARCRVMPPFSAITVTAKREGHERLGDLLRLLSNQAMATADFEPSDMSNQIALADATAGVPMALRDRWIFSMAPVDREDADQLLVWAKAHAAGEPVPPPEPQSGQLQDLEEASGWISAWLWLHHQFPKSFPDAVAAAELRDDINSSIETLLKNRRQHNRTLVEEAPERSRTLRL